MLPTRDEIGKQWTEYARELYSYKVATSEDVIDSLSKNSHATELDAKPEILLEEVEEAVRSMKNSKSPPVDNGMAELLKTGSQKSVCYISSASRSGAQESGRPSGQSLSLYHYPKKETCKIAATTKLSASLAISAK